MSSLSRFVLSVRAGAPSPASLSRPSLSSSLFTPSSSLLNTRSFSSSSFSSEKAPAPAVNEFHSLRESKGFLNAVQTFYSKYGGRLVENDFQGEKEVWLFNPKDAQKVIEAEDGCPVIPTDSYNHVANMMEKQSISSPFMGGCPHKWKATRQALEKDLSQESVQFYYQNLNRAAKDACEALVPHVDILEGVEKAEVSKTGHEDVVPAGLRPVEEKDYVVGEQEEAASTDSPAPNPFTPAPSAPNQYYCTNFPSFLLTVANDLSLSVSLGYNPGTTRELRNFSDLEGWRSGYDAFRHPETMIGLEEAFFPYGEDPMVTLLGEGVGGGDGVGEEEVTKGVEELARKWGVGGVEGGDEGEVGEGGEGEDSDGGLSSFEYFDEDPKVLEEEFGEEGRELTKEMKERHRKEDERSAVLAAMKRAVGGEEGVAGDLNPHEVDIPYSQEFNFLKNLSNINSMAALMAENPFSNTGEEKLSVYFENVMKRARFIVRNINNMMAKGRVTDACSLTPHAPIIFRLLHRGDMTLEEVEENFVHLLLAGVDSTRHVLSWLTLHIANNPDVQDKLRKELEEVVGNGPLLPSHNLPYLKSVIRESHRMTPPSAFTSYRMTDKDVSLDGFEIPKDTKVVFAMNPIQNDSSLIDEPSQFNPDRWSQDSVSSRKGTEKEVIDHPYLEKPYGFGARKCVGAHLADAQIECFVASLVRDFQIGFREDYKFPGAHLGELKEEKGVKRGEKGERVFNMTQEMYLRADPYPDLVFTPLK